MVIFPMYAVLVWSFTWRWRRSWPAFAALLLGVLGVALVAVLHECSRLVFPVALHGPLFPLLLAVEGIAITVVGLFICTLPRDRAELPCRRCRYELRGLDDANPTCPECGIAHAARKVRPRPCRACGGVLLVAHGDNPPCRACGCEHALFEIKPHQPDFFDRAVDAVIAVFQPRSSRYTSPSASTPSGRPTIIVRRNPDNTFTSIG